MSIEQRHDDFEVVIQNLFESQVYSHYNHLNTRSYAIHKALGGYYENIIGHIDELSELYMGEHPDYKINVPDSIQIPPQFSDDSPHKYFVELADVLEEMSSERDFSPTFEDRLRQTVELIRSTVYLLSRLK